MEGKLYTEVYLAPTPPGISERIDNPQILLYHLLQEYLVERDIILISVSLKRSVGLRIYKGGGGQALQGGLSWPPPRISKRMDNQQVLLHDLL